METNKKRRVDLEQDTATSGGMSPPFDEDNDHRGSGVGSVGATFPPPSRTDRGVSSPDHAGRLPGNSCLFSLT